MDVTCKQSLRPRFDMLAKVLKQDEYSQAQVDEKVTYLIVYVNDITPYRK